MPEAQITVAARMCCSSMTILVPNPLKMASAIGMRSSPFLLAQRHVIHFPTDMSVFGMDLIKNTLVPKVSSIFANEKPVTVEIST